MTLVAWGGGARCLLAAVEGVCIHIFSLKRYFDALAGGAPHFSATGGLRCPLTHRVACPLRRVPCVDPLSGGHSTRHGSGETDWIPEPCQHLVVLHMDSPVVAVDWTQAVDGIVASDRSGGVHAWRLHGEAVYAPSSPLQGGAPPMLELSSGDLTAEPLWRADMGQAQVRRCRLPRVREGGFAE